MANGGHLLSMEVNWREIDAISNQNMTAHSEAIFPALLHRL
jgi:hypothetical protein